MIGTSLTLALLGLGAVQALPTSTSHPVKERSPQGWFGFGPPSSSFSPGDGAAGDRDRCNWKETPFCLVPSGPSSGFKPGKEKRQSLGLPFGSQFKGTIEELERQLVELQNKRFKTDEDRDNIERLSWAIEYLAHVTSIQAPPGTSTTFTPGKRQAEPDFDLGGLQQAHSILRETLGQTQPSVATTLALQQMESLLSFYGASSSSPTQAAKRQITLGNAACQQLEIMALKMALAGLQAAYNSGKVEDTPGNIYLIEQLISSALALCKVDSTFTPGGTIIPGGPMKPDKPQPGGPIVPDRPTPGGPIKPSD